MSNEKKYTFSDITDIILTLGGLGFSTFITFAIFSAHFTPLPAFIVVATGWLTGGIGGYRLMNRRNEKLTEELKQLRQGSPTYAQSLPATSSYQREIIHAPQPEAVALEVRILDLLAMRKGRITLLETVVYLREPIDKVKPVLEKLQHDGFIGVDVSETGELIYTTDAFRVS